jgi:hypothetical protein
MSTQAVLSVLKDDIVQYKVIAGAQGMSIPYMKKFAMENPDATLEEVHEKAKELFGEDSTVTQGSPDTLLYMDEIDSARGLFKSKFYNAEFNPRWEQGTADCMDVLNLDKEHELTNKAELSLINMVMEPMSFYDLKNGSMAIVTEDHYIILQKDDKKLLNILNEQSDKYGLDHVSTVDIFNNKAERQLIAMHVYRLPMKHIQKSSEDLHSTDEFVKKMPEAINGILTETNHPIRLVDSLMHEENWDKFVKRERNNLVALSNDSTLTA